MKLSDDPEKAARSLANLKQNRATTPFAEGNQLGLRHGARARKLDPAVVEAKAREVMAAAPVRSADGGVPLEDAHVVRMLADVLVRIDLLAAYLAENGLFETRGKIRPAFDMERKLRDQALRFASELGMTPRSRAALGLDLARAQSAAERLDDHLKANYDVEGTAS